MLSNGAATANQPGSTVITASVSLVSSAAGYFFTCPPASIAASINGGATSATVTNGNPQNITTVVTDTQGNTITGANLDYTSTQPLQVSVAAGGSVSAAYAATATVSALCQPRHLQPRSAQPDRGLRHRVANRQQSSVDHLAGHQQLALVARLPGLAVLHAGRPQLQTLRQRHSPWR